ncbi:MAG: lysophospholipid acyltransferase family protein [Roseivirga sp.]|nr:lysophospholipid acyltransferase family protein [Roseivirga sp.]
MFFIKLLSFFPFWILYALCELTAFLAYYVFRYRRSVVSANVSRAFPDKTAKERSRIEVQFYRQFLQVLAEFWKSYSFKKEDWKQRMPITNPELVLSYLERGIPVVLVSGHTANWEWPAHSVRQQLGYPLEFLYKPVKNRRFDKIMLTLRTKHGGIAVPKDNAVREIIKRRKQPRLIGIIGDQLPSMGTEKHWLDFLNRETAFYKGAERIATMANYAVFYGDTERVSPGRYKLTFRQIAEPPYEKGQEGIIADYVSKLQASIHRDPSAYLWSHKRWKYTKKEEETALATSSS